MSPRLKYAIAAVTCLAIVPVLLAQVDYSKLPENPQKTAQLAASAKAGLNGAVKAAEDATKGKATKAELSRKDDKPVFLVHLVGTDKAFDVTVDGVSGNILDKQESALTAPTLPGEAVTGEPVTLPSGVSYYDMKVGTGDSPSTKAHKPILHTTGYLVDGKKFWSSLDRGEQLNMPLSNYVPGMQEGLATMKAGGKRKVIIPYQLGYGDRGNPPVIPPRAMLIFDVDLSAVQPPADAAPAPASGS